MPEGQTKPWVPQAALQSESSVTMKVGVHEGEGVMEGVGDDEDDGVAEGDDDGVSDGVIVGVALGEAEGVVVIVEVTVGVGDGLGDGAHWLSTVVPSDKNKGRFRKCKYRRRKHACQKYLVSYRQHHALTMHTLAGGTRPCRSQRPRN